ncbi:MAG: peptide-methionine (S)-S-oxide reductase MsrA, partial [Prochlorococcus sp.]
MFPSWLSAKASNQEPGHSTVEQHAVLGTALQAQITTDQEVALFACGCFWGAEKGFWKLPGVVTTAVGYAGGQKDKPTYQEVCSGRTGHTEAVRVVWNKTTIDFSDLLKLFWECHNPTQGNR